MAAGRAAPMPRPSADLASGRQWTVAARARFLSRSSFRRVGKLRVDPPHLLVNAPRLLLRRQHEPRRPVTPLGRFRGLLEHVHQHLFGEPRFQITGFCRL